MSTWTDKDESDLVARIRSANIQAEPTSQDYFLGIPPNYWRNQGVKEQQMPSSQIGDRWTDVGIAKVVEQDKLDRLTDLERKKQEQMNKSDDVLNKLAQYLPSLANISLLTSALSGNLPQTLFYLNKVGKEQMQSLNQGEQKELQKLKTEIADLQKQIQKFEKQQDNIVQQAIKEPKTKKKARKGKGGPCTNKKWVDHYKGVKAGNPGMCYKDLLEKAKSSYKRN